MAASSPTPVWLLLCVAAFAGGCFQELDSGADKETRQLEQNPAKGPTTAVAEGDLPIGTNPDDEGETVGDPCEKTRRDKTEILTAYCASCHHGQPAKGLPAFDFVLDDKRLVQEVWVRTGQPNQRFVIPGDPDHSALYVRAATDMPPIPTDLGTRREPAPTPSDLSILREWITHCIQ